MELSPAPFLIFRLLDQLRDHRPLIYNMTNTVSQDLVANGLLALGASPVMSCASEEIQEFVNVSSALSLNIGTVDAVTKSTFLFGAKAAKHQKKPCVFDPVGSGASVFRTQTATEILETGAVGILRGNASEILSLTQMQATTKGVDAVHDSLQIVEQAKAISRRFGCTVVVSGQTDVVTDGDRISLVRGGAPLMTSVTGMGCLASAICAAFFATEKDSLIAAAAAMSVMGWAAEQALKPDPDCGPGTFRQRFIDQLFHLGPGDEKF